jgi:transcriptional regulator with XRE-family HTH domain
MASAVYVAPMRFDQKLILACEARGWDQATLARKVGVSPSTSGRWCKGERLPKLEDAVKLAQVLDMSLDYLFDDSLDEPPSYGPTVDTVVLELYHMLGPAEARRRLANVPDTGTAHAPPPPPLPPPPPPPTRRPDGSFIDPNSVDEPPVRAPTPAHPRRGMA